MMPHRVRLRAPSHTMSKSWVAGFANKVARICADVQMKKQHAKRKKEEQE